MTTRIASSLIVCRKAFNDLIVELQYAAEVESQGLSLRDWEDERGRLRLWAANIGAHQTGQSSLDFRLRDSSHIHQQIVKLLDELLRRIKDARAVLAEGEDSDVESIEDSSSEGGASQTEVQQLRRSVATIINCLFEMSILVRKPAQHDIRIGAKQSDVSGYEWADLRHVRDKFPTIDDQMAARLGQAITRRRKYLIYRKRHADKLRQGIDHDIVSEAPPAGSDVLSETVATDFRIWNIDADDKASESGFSQTSYAPTLISGGAITIPHPPEASQNGAPFECPYCYYIICAPTTKAWNRHVFDDLQAYICIERRCTVPDKLYATKHEWISHLRTAHDHEVYSVHMCTLCGISQSTSERHQQHVARHLQELALFILPRDDDDSDGDEASIAAAAAAAAAAATIEAEKKAAEKAAELADEAAKAKAAAEEAEKRDDEIEAAAAAAVAAAALPPEERKKPITFKDTLGRKFGFPFHLCCTWEGMEDLIRQAFLHVEIVGPQVAEGRYDLVGPNGEIILPHVWETMIKPGWVVTMHMWAIPEPPSAPAPPEGADDDVIEVPSAEELRNMGFPTGNPEEEDDTSKPSEAQGGLEQLLQAGWRLEQSITKRKLP